MRTFLLLLISLSSITFAQSNRFKTKVFNESEYQYDVVYGQAITQAGEIMKLTMDVYQPKGDTMSKRPVVILAHGGYFFFGDKVDLQLECEQLAEAGFVAVSINYRLIDVEDDSFYVAKRAVIDAIADMKAAVRYFYKDAANQDKYRVDTDNIFIGGYSAGAITSLHYAYANTTDDVLMMGGEIMLKYIQKSGGLEGTSGNPGYPNKVRGIINISGALFNADMVDANEPVLFSIHGTDDEIVPYEKGLAGTTKVLTHGSSLIHKRAKQVGVTNYLKTIEKGDHYSFIDCEPCIVELLYFLNNNLQK